MSMMWVGIGSVVVGAAASVYSSNQASGAINSASKNATNAELQMYNQSRADLAPYRQAGYGALDQITQLYGISNPQGSQWTAQFGTPIQVGGTKGKQGGVDLTYAPDPLGLFGGGSKSVFGGTIDPITGTVTIPGDARRSAMATEYLRTGQGLTSDNPRMANLMTAIDSLRSQGWTYDPNRTAQSASTSTAPATRDLSQFYASPQYNFTRSEGLRGLENSAAARGGALSGNAIRGSEMFASNLASGEFNSYVDRLFSIAGLGTNATNTGVAAGQNTANNLSAIYQNQGNARASGYYNAGMGVNNAIQSGMQNYAFANYMNPNSGLSPVDIYTKKI